jgi:hypothetical protein
MPVASGSRCGYPAGPVLLSKVQTLKGHRILTDQAPGKKSPFEGLERPFSSQPAPDR